MRPALIITAVALILALGIAHAGATFDPTQED